MSNKKLVGFIALGVIVAIGIAWAAFGLRVATAPVRGQGEAHIAKHSAKNWTAAQARFEEMYANIEATDRKIELARAALEANPDDKTAQQTLTGTQNYCVSAVGEYNAEARKYLAADFKASDLPEQINDNQQSTDCE